MNNNNKDNIQEQKLRGTFSAAIAAYEKDNLVRATRQIGLDMGIPIRYNFDGVMDEPS